MIPLTLKVFVAIIFNIPLNRIFLGLLIAPVTRLALKSMQEYILCLGFLANHVLDIVSLCSKQMSIIVIRPVVARAMGKQEVRSSNKAGCQGIGVQPAVCSPFKYRSRFSTTQSQSLGRYWAGLQVHSKPTPLKHVVMFKYARPCIKRFLELITEFGILPMLTTIFNDIVTRLVQVPPLSSNEIALLGLIYDFHVSLLSTLDKYRCFAEIDAIVDSQLLNATFESDSSSEDWTYLKDWVIGTWDLLLSNIKFTHVYLCNPEKLCIMVSKWSISMNAVAQRLIYEEMSKADDSNISRSHFVESVSFSQLPRSASDLLFSAASHLLLLLESLQNNQKYGGLIELTFISFWRTMSTLKGYAFVAVKLSAFILEQGAMSNRKIISDILKLLHEDSRSLNLLDVCFVVSLQVLDSFEKYQDDCNRVVEVFTGNFSRSLHGIMDCQLLPSILHWLPVAIQQFLTVPTHSSASDSSDFTFNILVMEKSPPLPSKYFIYLSKIYAIILADLSEMEVHDRTSQFSQHSTQTMDSMVTGIRALVVLPLLCIIFHPHWFGYYLGDDKKIKAWSKLLHIWLSIDSEASIVDSLSLLLASECFVIYADNNRYFSLHLRLVQELSVLITRSSSRSRRIDTRLSSIVSLVLVQTLFNLSFVTAGHIPMVLEEEQGADDITEAIKVLSRVAHAMKKCNFSVKYHECQSNGGIYTTGILLSYHVIFLFLEKLSALNPGAIDSDIFGRWTYALLLIISENFDDIHKTSKTFIANLLTSFCSTLAEHAQSHNSTCLGFIVQFWHQHLHGSAPPAVLIKNAAISGKRSSEPSPKRVKSSVVVVEKAMSNNPCEIRSAFRVKSLFKGEAETQSQSHPIPFDPPCEAGNDCTNDIPCAESPSDSLSRKVSFKESSVEAPESTEKRRIESSNHELNGVDVIIQGLNRSKRLLQSKHKDDLDRGFEGLTDALVALAKLQRDTLKGNRGLFS